MKRENKIIQFAYAMLVFLEAGANAQFAKDAAIEVRVLDEQSTPIKDAQVAVSFSVMRTSNVFDGTEPVGKFGRTDSDGKWDISSKTTGEIFTSAVKDGYYKSTTNFVFHDEKEKWVAPVSLVLLKKALPIPMYAKHLEYVELPTTNSPVGYDLVAGDWVAPHGKGAESDLDFILQREFKSRYDFKWQLAVQFAGDGNGWQAISPADETSQSELRFPRTAPADGYIFKDMFLAFSRGSFGRMETNSATATNYFFQVRSERDANKRLISAKYGKLLGPIQVNVQGTKTAKLSFTYYLNPTTLDRNMEFDPKKNLFKGLQSMEQVSAP